MKQKKIEIRIDLVDLVSLMKGNIYIVTMNNNKPDIHIQVTEDHESDNLGRLFGPSGQRLGMVR